MSYTITLPSGASGVVLQGDGCYWSLDGEMTGADQGFKLGTSRETVWVIPSQTPVVYCWVPPGSRILFQSIVPLGGQ